MKHGMNTDFTNEGANPCFIRVSSVTEIFCLLRNKCALDVKYLSLSKSRSV
jgi:hypothetical protein